MRGTYRIAAAAAAAMLSVGLVAGCGGEPAAPADTTQSATTTASAPLTVEEYRAQANAVCVTSRAAEDQVAEPTDEAELLTFLDAQEAIGTEYVNSLKALTPPATFDADHAALVGAGEDGLALVDTLRTQVEGGATMAEAMATLSQEGAAVTEAKKRAVAAMGLTECATS